MLYSIELTNFKSHQAIRVDFEAQSTAIIGPNASGKTNLLEAIYYSFMGKPFYGRNSQLIYRGSDFSKIVTVFGSEKKIDLEHRLKLNSPNLKRSVKLNNSPIPISQLVGTQQVVTFLPDDSQIITGSPSFRRNLLNSIAVQTSPTYKHAYSTFQKILNQRNRLLYAIKNNLPGSKDQLFVYNLQMAAPIEAILANRYELIEFFNKTLSLQYSLISGRDDKIHLEYLPTLPKDKDDIVKTLEQNSNQDFKYGFTARGPHKDDMLIKLNNYNAREGLSRGENRSLALAIKLSEIEYMQSIGAQPPILLLDDVLSELDDSRQKKLLEAARKKQTIITTTSLNDNVDGFKSVEL